MTFTDRKGNIINQYAYRSVYNCKNEPLFIMNNIFTFFFVKQIDVSFYLMVINVYNIIRFIVLLKIVFG